MLYYAKLRPAVQAFCEDHLPAGSEIVKSCRRFEALGYNQSKTGYFIFCSAACLQFAKNQNLIFEEAFQASAGSILESAGVDLTDTSNIKFDRCG